jgi:hypothetical protein
MKKAKVVSVNPQGDYQLKDGRTLYKFVLSFDNGDTGEYSSVKPDQNKFVVGQEAEYELNATQYGNRIKPVYNQGGGFSGGGYSGGSYSSGGDTKQKMIVKQSCLKAAVDLLKDKGAKSTDVLKVADSFVSWVLEEDKKETSYDNHFSSREEKIQVANAIVNGSASEDDLPF